MLAMTPETNLALDDDVLIQALPDADHYFAFNVKTGDQFRLNETAHWVLEAISVEVSFGGLTDKFAQAFDLGFDEARGDLSEVLAFGLDNGLVKEVSL